jgi:hypothetical protein
MKIEIKNRTHWNTSQLRAFIKRALPMERADLCKRGAPALRVAVKWNRGGDTHNYVTGCAAYHSNWMTLKLASGSVDRIDLVHTIVHELAHTRGMKHPEMTGDPLYTRSGNWRELYAWAESLPLEKVSKTKPKPTADVKIAHTQKMLKLAMTRERRATTIRKRWQARLKRLERSSLQLVA